MGEVTHPWVRRRRRTAAWAAVDVLASGIAVDTVALGRPHASRADDHRAARVAAHVQAPPAPLIAGGSNRDRHLGAREETLADASRVKVAEAGSTRGPDDDRLRALALGDSLEPGRGGAVGNCA
jgi:hypothetical protein